MRRSFVGLGTMGAAATLNLICPEPGIHTK